MDIETYSDIDISNGVYRYVDSPFFQILLVSYAFDDEDVVTVDLACGEELPHSLLTALQDPDVEIHAFNAGFERICLSKYLGLDRPLSPDNWWDTQVHAAMYGLPASLKDVAKVLGLAEQKDSAGTYLINFFSKPCKATKANGMRERNLPVHDMAKWDLYKKYNKQDVVTERAISRYLSEHYTKDLESEKYNYRVNERINDNGIMIDTDLCRAIIEYNTTELQRQLDRAKAITHLENPNSLQQLRGWLASRGIHATAITKDSLPEIIKATDDAEVIEVLTIRQNLSKTSVTKYQTMLDAVCSDGRVHGVFKFYGASRTGRFSGKIIQPQNYPRNYMEELDAVRDLVKKRDWAYLEMAYDDIQDIFKQLLRTALIAPQGKVITIADYSAIEARVIAWLAHEKWAEDVFHGDGKIYEATASQMFGVPIERIKKGNPEYALRQKGKTAVLGLGYGGGKNALINMGALKSGLTEEELPDLVTRWRNANPHIVGFWRKIEQAARGCIEFGVDVVHEAFTFRYRDGNMFVRLPSGRWLTYYSVQISEEDGITYCGNDAKGWCRLKTFGGKLVENIVQAVARDLLCDSLGRLDTAGIKVIGHIHDEILCETDNDPAQLIRLKGFMQMNNGSWDAGLFHPAAGFQTPYYLKD